MLACSAEPLRRDEDDVVGRSESMESYRLDAAALDDIATKLAADLAAPSA